MQRQLFSEGVDVPSLDAVVFLEPRNSQVDVVQAVGRVMRRGPNKELGYIVVPVVVPEGATTLDALERGSDGYKLIGQVLRALQSHDGRLAEETARLVIVAQPIPAIPSTGEGGDEDKDGQSDGVRLDRDHPEVASPGAGGAETGDLFEHGLESIRRACSPASSSPLASGAPANSTPRTLDIQWIALACCFTPQAQPRHWLRR